MTTTVIQAITAARNRFPTRTRSARIVAELEQHRAAGDDGEQQARVFERVLQLREQAASTPPSEWAGPVTDYVLERQRVAALGVVCAVTARFADAWATATGALADGVSGLPPVDVDDPTDVALWRAEAERVVARALVNVPAPQIVPVPR